MKQIAIVKGMKCHHCEMHAKEALMKIDGVLNVEANHSTNKVIIECERLLSEEEIKKAIDSTGYQFEGLE